MINLVTAYNTNKLQNKLFDTLLIATASNKKPLEWVNMDTQEPAITSWLRKTEEYTLEFMIMLEKIWLSLKKNMSVVPFCIPPFYWIHENVYSTI